MDLTSKISLLLSITELILAVWTYAKFEKSRLSILVVSILIILGVTHFCQYQVCLFGNFAFWGRVNFIFYNLIPLLITFYGFEEVLNKRVYLFFIPYILFTLPAIFMTRFAVLGKCQSGIMTILNYFFYATESFWPSLFHFLYIAFFSLLGSSVLFYGAKKVSAKKEKIYFFIGLSIFLSFIIPTTIVAINPLLRRYFPSIIHYFLASYLFTGIASLYLEKKIIDQDKQKNPGY